MKQQKIEPFSGFSPETFKFFNDLKEYNHKPWFDKNKPIYEEEILRPLKALAHVMTPVMYAIDPRINMNPNKIVSRIYRDVRFSKDKTPYRTSMWISFQRLLTDWQNFPGYYLEISENGYQYGMGLYLPKKKEMDNFRSAIEYDPNHFREMTEDLIGKNGFIIGGEEYKRPMGKNALPEYFQQWIQRKSIYLYKQFPVGEELFSVDFAQFMADEYTLLLPLYDYLVEICEE